MLKMATADTKPTSDRCWVRSWTHPVLNGTVSWLSLHRISTSEIHPTTHSYTWRTKESPSEWPPDISIRRGFRDHSWSLRTFCVIPSGAWVGGWGWGGPYSQQEPLLERWGDLSHMSQGRMWGQRHTLAVQQWASFSLHRLQISKIEIWWFYFNFYPEYL